MSVVDEKKEWKVASPMVAEGLGRPWKSKMLGLVSVEAWIEKIGGASAG